MITLSPRDSIPFAITLLTPILAILFTLFMGLIIFSFLGYDPVKSLYYFFIAPVSRPDQVAALAVKACPLILIASGLVFCYRSNIWNIGAEGQLVFGAIFSGWVALSFLESDSIFLLPSMIIASIIGGLLWAMIPAILKIKFNTNEISFTNANICSKPFY
jgi:simple sugar transport system permease protein